MKSRMACWRMKSKIVYASWTSPVPVHSDTRAYLQIFKFILKNLPLFLLWRCKSLLAKSSCLHRKKNKTSSLLSYRRLLLAYNFRVWLVRKTENQVCDPRKFFGPLIATSSFRGASLWHKNQQKLQNIATIKRSVRASQVLCRLPAATRLATHSTEEKLAKNRVAEP